MFCPKCNSLMRPQEGRLVCTRCGHTVEISKTKRSTVRTEMKADVGTLVVEGKSDTLPKTEIKCPKCGNNEAYWVLRQTRAADEPETRIYRCTRCSYSWREY